MPSSTGEKRSIAQFFQPHFDSDLTRKRPSPAASDDGQRTKSARQVTRPSGSPRLRTGGSSELEQSPISHPVGPLSPPGSEGWLPFRSSQSHTSSASGSAHRHPAPSVRPRDQSPLASKAPTLGSFADIPKTPSIHTVTRAGKVVEVLDSDDEDGSDDLESLPSLADIIRKGRGKGASPQSSAPEDGDEEQLEVQRVKTLSLFTRGRSEPLVGKDKLRALCAKEKAQKFDLAGLLEDHHDDEKTEDHVQKALAAIDESAKASALDQRLALDKQLLAEIAITADADYGVARLMDAVDRTEALDSDRRFLFCGTAGLNDWRRAEPTEYDFPEGVVPPELWPVGDGRSRSRAFTSGHVTEIAWKGLLPDAVLRWVFLSFLLEQQDALREAYLDCLRAASSSWTRTNITAGDVQSVFRTLGADPVSVRDGVVIEPRHYLLKDPETRDPKFLLAVLTLFDAIHPDMDFVALKELTSLVCRMTLDIELMSDCRVAAKTDALLAAMLAASDRDVRSHIAGTVFASMGRYLKSPKLQIQLLSHIMPVSTTARRLRVRLAHHFLLAASDAEEDASSHEVSISLERLADHVVKSPSFNTRQRRAHDELDYGTLRALAQILDVAIADGGRPPAFDSPVDERHFNKAVDRLADVIRAAFIAIIDSGASHMRRTEAKDTLQALHWRLLYSVRTQPRPKKNIFDDNTGRMRTLQEKMDEDGGRRLMERFLAASKPDVPALSEVPKEEESRPASITQEAATLDVRPA